MDIKIEEIDIISNKPQIFYEKIGKAYLENKLSVNLIRNKGLGAPDYRYYKDGQWFYVEFKSNEDGLRKEQIRWIINHKELNFTLFWLHIIRSKEMNSGVDEEEVEENVDETVIKVHGLEFMELLNKLFDINKNISKESLIYSLSDKFDKPMIERKLSELEDSGYIFEIKKGIFERL